MSAFGPLFMKLLHLYRSFIQHVRTTETAGAKITCRLLVLISGRVDYEGVICSINPLKCSGVVSNSYIYLFILFICSNMIEHNTVNTINHPGLTYTFNF